MNTQRLLENLATYAEIGALPNGGVERLALSSTDKQARDMFKKQMLEAGLDVKVDEIGNMFGIRKGTSALPAVMIGSHLDTVGNGGKFDGSLGVLAALEIIHTLNERNLTTKRPIIIANFTNEEGVRFTPDMMGSLVFSRQYLVDKAYQSKAIDGSGTLLAYELDKIGYKGKLKCGSLNIDYFLELHIEQGPILEKENIPVGIVESLQGISWTEFIFYGESNHAGTTPLAYRKDAGLAAVALATYINESVRTKGGNQVGTVGIIEMFPNQINVIPKKARLTCDLRNTNETTLAIVEKDIETFAKQVAKRESLTLEINRLARFKPIEFSNEVTDVLKQAADNLNLKSKKMYSGAGHDAQMIAKLCPAAMLFIPSKDGITHNPAEFSTDKAIEDGAKVLYEACLALAGK